jgi:hypothetical protein
MMFGPCFCLNQESLDLCYKEIVFVGVHTTFYYFYQYVFC